MPLTLIRRYVNEPETEKANCMAVGEQVYQIVGMPSHASIPKREPL
jgi:hypothetical protein